jgi:hypothetical protein
MGRQRVRRLAGRMGTAVLAAWLLLMPAGASSASDGWQSIAPGLDYRLYALPGPVKAHVARMDRSEPTVTIDTAIALGRLNKGLETVSGMAARYDGTLSAWPDGWGGTNHVMVAINGSGFDYKSAVPLSGLIQSGWYAKRFTDLTGTSGFIWTTDRHAFIGQCITQDPTKQYLTFGTGSQRIEIDGINTRRPNNGLVIFTPQSGTSTGSDSRAYEVQVELSRPGFIIPAPSGVQGTVIGLQPEGGATRIPFNGIVISARGEAARRLKQYAQMGQAVTLTMEVKDLGIDCKGGSGNDWTKAYAGLAGGFEFLADGKIRSSDDLGNNSRLPRTAVCLNDKYVYFVVIDGRDDSLSRGMTTDELGEFCHDRLQATWGINQDGGGSSTMWIDGKVVNTPSDGHERGVANALMMVTVQPAQRSFDFVPGRLALIARRTDLRLGPGTEYGVRAVLQPGAVGRINPDPNQLNGVMGDEIYWWHMAFGTTSGWVDEGSLQRIWQAVPTVSLDVWPPATPEAGP